jgi:diadenosine tetraphosphate (Ap4A) HIT family hydrolase
MVRPGGNECPICLKHRGEGPLVGPVIYQDDLVFVAHRATGSLGYAFVETQRHAPYLDDLTDEEAAAVGRVASRLARGLRAELDANFVHTAVSGLGVAHFHEHVFVRHGGTPDLYTWWQEWPDAPHGDIPALAKRLGAYFD